MRTTGEKQVSGGRRGIQKVTISGGHEWPPLSAAGDLIQPRPGPAGHLLVGRHTCLDVSDARPSTGRKEQKRQKLLPLT